MQIAKVTNVKTSLLGRVYCVIMSILKTVQYCVFPCPQTLSKIIGMRIMANADEYYVIEVDDDRDEEAQLTIDDYLYSIRTENATEEDVRAVLKEFKAIEEEFNDLMRKRTALVERRTSVLAALKDYTKGKPLVININDDSGRAGPPETHIVRVTDVGVSFLRVGSVNI